ncbi:hypothetical protein Bra1253DRAFT_06030 [Bradyrhizobium sp. WSM1253]|nr:hypothetical protein Bra1253DRAFT_06030 [Bradyrhizobium sp. WSM1253]
MVVQQSDDQFRLLEEGMHVFSERYSYCRVDGLDQNQRTSIWYSKNAADWLYGRNQF